MHRIIFSVILSASALFNCKSRQSSSELHAPVPKSFKKYSRTEFYRSIAGEYTLEGNTRWHSDLPIYCMAPSKFTLKAFDDDEAKSAAETRYSTKWEKMDDKEKDAAILREKESMIIKFLEEEPSPNVQVFGYWYDLTEGPDGVSRNIVDPKDRKIFEVYYNNKPKEGLATELDFSEENKLTCRFYKLSSNKDKLSVDEMKKLTLPPFGKADENTRTFLRKPKEE